MGQIAFGLWLNDVPRHTPDRAYFVNLHKSTGLVIGLLLLLRIGWRLMHAPPPLPRSMPRWQRWLARVDHAALYVVFLSIPLAGYIASNFSKWGVKLFNVITLPPWGHDDKAIYAFFNQTHTIAVAVLVGLLVLHVAAAVWHALRRDGVFSRIWLRPF